MNNKSRFKYSTLGYFVSTLIGASLLFGCNGHKQEEPLHEILKDSVVDSTGQLAKPPHSVLLNTDHLLLYFSAHWCPPCKKFTPKLVDFYNTHNGGKDFRVVLISQDHSAKDMHAYMQKMNMPWQAIQFNSACAKKLKDTYSGDGIPRLVLVNPQGEVLADSFEEKNFVGPEHVLKELEKRLPKPLPEFKKPAATPRTAKAKPAVTPKTTPTKAPVAKKPALTAQDSKALEQLKKEYELSGIGHASKGSIAIINNNIVSEGALLPNGAKVDKITDTYVDVILDGKRYRLYPKKKSMP